LKLFEHRDAICNTISYEMASTVQQSAMSGGEIVLGLLVEAPGTCYQLDKRLAERLGSAQFARGTAARAVQRLLERDLIRPADGDSDASLRALEGRRKRRYEATPAGVEHFRRWLRASTQTPPVREELHAKIALWGAEDLPRLIEIVREAEIASTQQLQELNRRTRREHESAGASEWSRVKQLIVTTGELAWWDARIRWLQDVRLYLERESQCRPSAEAEGRPQREMPAAGTSPTRGR
jgi:DNA-binding PadR family transcriptional regulator